MVPEASHFVSAWTVVSSCDLTDILPFSSTLSFMWSADCCSCSALIKSLSRLAKYLSSSAFSLRRIFLSKSDKRYRLFRAGLSHQGDRATDLLDSCLPSIEHILLPGDTEPALPGTLLEPGPRDSLCVRNGAPPYAMVCPPGFVYTPLMSEGEGNSPLDWRIACGLVITISWINLV